MNQIGAKIEVALLYVIIYIIYINYISSVITSKYCNFIGLQECDLSINCTLCDLQSHPCPQPMKITLVFTTSQSAFRIQNMNLVSFFALKFFKIDEFEDFENFDRLNHIFSD